MILNIVVIRDAGAKVYSVPQFVASVGGFVRAFGDQIKAGAKDDQLAAHPEDFEAFHVGTYDDNTRRFEFFDTDVSICRGVDYK